MFMLGKNTHTHTDTHTHTQSVMESQAARGGERARACRLSSGVCGNLSPPLNHTLTLSHTFTQIYSQAPSHTHTHTFVYTHTGHPSVQPVPRALTRWAVGEVWGGIG